MTEAVQKMFLNAVEDGSCEGVLEACRRGASVSVQDGWALTIAATKGHKDVAELLIDLGLDVCNRHNSPLRHAAENGHYEVVQLLLDKGADSTALAEQWQWKYADQILGEGTIARMQGTEQRIRKEKLAKQQNQQQTFRRYIKGRRGPL